MKNLEIFRTDDKGVAKCDTPGKQVVINKFTI